MLAAKDHPATFVLSAPFLAVVGAVDPVDPAVGGAADRPATFVLAAPSPAMAGAVDLVRLEMRAAANNPAMFVLVLSSSVVAGAGDPVRVDVVERRCFNHDIFLIIRYDKELLWVMVDVSGLLVVNAFAGKVGMSACQIVGRND